MLQIYFEKLVVNSGKSFALERTEINSKNINTLILFYIAFHHFSPQSHLLFSLFVSNSLKGQPIPLHFFFFILYLNHKISLIFLILLQYVLKPPQYYGPRL